MGFRFHKRFGFLPRLRLNLSASRRGITPGVSIGAPGFRVSTNANGEQHASVGLPGSGVRYATQRVVRGPWAGSSTRASAPTSYGRQLFWAFVWGAAIAALLFGGLLVA